MTTTLKTCSGKELAGIKFKSDRSWMAYSHAKDLMMARGFDDELASWLLLELYDAAKKDKAKRENLPAVITDLQIPEQVYQDWITVRKAKKAGPVTSTVMAMIDKEAGKAGITTAQAVAIAAARGWQSFKADWIAGTNYERTRMAKEEHGAKSFETLAKADDKELGEWGV